MMTQKILYTSALRVIVTQIGEKNLGQVRMTRSRSFLGGFKVTQ